MLGDMLRQEREKQNLSIKDVERETSIRSLYISSIEEGNYDAVPGEVYLKGFIKTYATFLNLDGAAMLKLYYEEKQPDAAKAESAVLTQENKVGSAGSSERKSIKELREEKKNSSGGALKAAALLLCLCIGGAYFFFSGGAPDKAAGPKAGAPEIAQQEKPAAPAPKVHVPKPSNAAVKGVEVKASFTGRCWTHVEADGKTLYEGIAKAGESLAWKADKELVITAGNAGAVELVSNGKSLGKLGNNGEVVTKKFSKEGQALSK